MEPSLSHRSPNGFDRLVEEVRLVPRCFCREIESSVYHSGEDHLVLTRLNDEFHDMFLAMKIGPDRVIREIEARMDRIPYLTCDGAISQLACLKGVFVFERGILRKIRTMVPRGLGCTHLMELIESSLRALFAVIESEMHRDERNGAGLTKEEARNLNLLEPVLADTCLSFNTRTADPAVLESARQKLDALGRGAA